MPLAADQELPVKPKEKSEPWTTRRLFPLTAAVSAFSKTFTNPFDVMVGFLIFIIGSSELFGRDVSWMLYVFTAFLLLVDLGVRKESTTTENKMEAKK